MESNINLVIESLRLWQLLLYYNVGLDSIADIPLILTSQIQSFLSYHNIQKTSELECEYITTLIIVASQETTLRSKISILLAKWSTQLSSLSNIRVNYYEFNYLINLKYIRTIFIFYLLFYHFLALLLV
jgi:hypothetical protein